MLGYVDTIDGGLAKGWIVDEREGRRGLVVELWLDGRKVAEAVADRRREDLFKFGLDGEAAGFVIPFARTEHDDVGGAVRLVEASTGFVLPPGLIAFDPPATTGPLDIRRLEPRIARRIAAARSVADLDEEIAALGRLSARGGARRAELRRLAPAAGVTDRFSPLVFERPETPVVSVVIAARDSFAALHACLRSLAEPSETTPFEVIVIDDGFSDETRAMAAILVGVVLIRPPGATGAASARNAGAALARGEYLMFLDAETQVTPGWLDATAKSFSEADIGVVGARLIGRDGRVLACGGAIDDKGAAALVGRGADPRDPHVRWRRDCDFVSGSALAIRKSLFETLGGFDAACAPREDVDLSARARTAGLRVVVQPAASMIGRGDDADLPFNQAEVARDNRPRALFIDSWTPRPDRDAGSNVAVQHMLGLRRLGFHVIFAAGETLEDAPGYTQDLERLGIEGVYAPFYASIEAALDRLAPLELVYLHRFNNADKYLETCRRRAPGAAIVYNAADLHSLREARASKLGLPDAGDVEAKREFALLARADAAIVHSSHEFALVRAHAAGANVHCVAWPVAVARHSPPFAVRRDIGFIGSFGHAPNPDAMRTYAREILPAFAGAPPLLRMAGSDMPDDIRALANAHITAEGQVDDLGAFLSSLRATVAPLRFGAGLKGKVLESLAHGTPCVMTSIAAEGLELPEALQMCMVDAPGEVTAMLARIVDDEILWERLSEAGRAYIAQRYSRERVDEGLGEAIASARVRAGARRPS